MHTKPVEAAIPVCVRKVPMYDVGEGKVLVANVIPLLKHISSHFHDILYLGDSSF
jgi:hypothetical protein